MKGLEKMQEEKRKGPSPVARARRESKYCETMMIAGTKSKPMPKEARIPRLKHRNPTVGAKALKINPKAAIKLPAKVTFLQSYISIRKQQNGAINMGKPLNKAVMKAVFP